MKIIGEAFDSDCGISVAYGLFLVEGCTSKASFDCKHGVVAENGHELEV